MNRLACAAFVIAAGSLFASEAYATPTFQLLVDSGTYNSGAISGTIDPGGLTGTVSVSGLVASGGGGNAFTVGSINGTFDLTNLLDINLAASNITHTANTSGDIRFFLTLDGLDDPNAPMMFTNAFAGTFASTNQNNRATTRVHLGQNGLFTQVLLFDTGSVGPNSVPADCTLPTTTSYSCLQIEGASAPGDPFSVREMIDLRFAANTLDLSEDVSQHITATVPEPASFAIFALGILAAFGFRNFKRQDGQTA